MKKSLVRINSSFEGKFNVLSGMSDVVYDDIFNHG